MINKETSIESVSPDDSVSELNAVECPDGERSSMYKAYAMAFSYPDDKFFGYFPDMVQEKAKIIAEYDQLFRAGAVWLYGAEHLSENEFQRANLLSDIMGFYTAFGAEPDKERPDSITCEMEFMDYLIFKRARASQGLVGENPEQKADICRDAERKFFMEHLEPAAQKIAENIISKAGHHFYVQKATELLEFLECERKHFGCEKVKEEIAK